MTSEDVFKGRLKLGDRVRSIHTHEVFVVNDMIQTDVRGEHVALFCGKGVVFDITEVEKV